MLDHAECSKSEEKGPEASSTPMLGWRWWASLPSATEYICVSVRSTAPPALPPTSQPCKRACAQASALAGIMFVGSSSPHACIFSLCASLPHAAAVPPAALLWPACAPSRRYVTWVECCLRVVAAAPCFSHHWGTLSTLARCSVALLSLVWVAWELPGWCRCRCHSPTTH